MYSSKKQDHEKRKMQEGSYSLYNHLYNYLLNNYEPDNLQSSESRIAALNLMIAEGSEYLNKGGNMLDSKAISKAAKDAMKAFIANNGRHGDTANNLGNAQDNSFQNVVRSVMDLRW